MMKAKKYSLYLLLPLLFLSCQDDLESVDASVGNAVELTQIQAVIATSGNYGSTRADGDGDGDPAPTPPPVYLEDHISRFRFVASDRMTFTKVQRTLQPIPRFTYTDIDFLTNESGAWDRIKDTGSDGLNGAGVHPARIYWSDATSPHTFIGYSLPNVKALLKDANATFDWDKQEGGVYYGSIGDPNATTQINYHPAEPEKDEYTVTENEVEVSKEVPMSSLMRAEDLLLTYDTEVVANASVANIKFYHGLSSIKVKVILSDFYGSELDGYTIVENMVLESQPTLYKWLQDSYKASARYTGNNTTHQQNNPRDMKLWDYVPNGEGTNAGKTFTFYGITVPQEDGYDWQDLKLSFGVKYPDPLKTDLTELKTNPNYQINWQDTKTYKATIPKATPVYFHPNKCTIITIKLNHRDEVMTIGAQYTDWEFVPTPDEGSLKKNSTFLQEAPVFNADENKRKVTIAKDSKATEDDATWLYYQKNPDGMFVSGSDDGKVLLDIYGHTGSESSPYTISTANQLLSLAYEVSNGGHSFQDKYIKLDAGIIMQKDVDSETVSWLGIGTADNPFQGTFLGAGRKITRLKGNPLFNYVGDKAVIDNVTIENPLVGPETIVEDKATVPNPNYLKLLTGNAALVQNNAGVICACRVNGDVGCSGSGAVGALVGTNSGTIFACHHTGLVKGNGDVAGLVGSNSGTILFSYHAGELRTTSTKYGIAPGGTTGCYYDSKLAPAVTAVTETTGQETGELQKEEFVTGINNKIATWLNALTTDAHYTDFSKHQYIYQPAAYPKVE